MNGAMHRHLLTRHAPPRPWLPLAARSSRRCYAMSRSIQALACGNSASRRSRSPISKVENWNPGATVHPTCE